MQFCVQADVERALGGAKVLRQLLDPNQTGVIDAQSVTDVLDLGTTEVSSYIQLAVELSALVNMTPFPRILVLKTADVCAYHAFLRGSNGQGPPENIVARYEAAIRWAKDVGQRAATLGADPKPALDPPAEMIDPQLGPIPAGFGGDWEMKTSPPGGAITIGGFRRSGFR